jgi:hypothetical protein
MYMQSLCARAGETLVQWPANERRESTRNVSTQIAKHNMVAMEIKKQKNWVIFVISSLGDERIYTAVVLFECFACVDVRGIRGRIRTRFRLACRPRSTHAINAQFFSRQEKKWDI